MLLKMSKRPFRDLFRRSIFICILAALWCPFGSLLVPFRSLLAPFGSLLVPFGSLLALFGSLLVPFSSLLAPFWCSHWMTAHNTFCTPRSRGTSVE